MSIVLRLNALIAALMLASLTAFAAATLMQAEPRIHSESQSISLLAREIFLKSLDALAHAPDPAAGLESLVAKLQNVRHVSVSLVRPAAPTEDLGGSGPAAPRKNNRPESNHGTDAERIPVVIGGQNLGAISITPRSSDEISEIWDATASAARSALVFLVAAFLLTSWAVQRSLQPIHRLEQALKQMQDGDFDIDVAQDGPPEITGIAEQVNALAAALRRARSENRLLSESLVTAQDAERREIARELHDEQGPHLFSVRAQGTALRAEAGGPTPDVARINQLAAGMLEQIEALQINNRRVLRRLTPPGLSEVGLLDSIEGLIAFWRKERPEVAIRLAATADAGELDDTMTLTIYRVIQEGLTNAMKHARPSEVAITIALASESGSSGPRQTLTLALEDNGEGGPETIEPGFGLTGMRERVAALGGMLLLERPSNGGTRLSMTLRNRPAPTSITPSSTRPKSAASGRE